MLDSWLDGIADKIEAGELEPPKRIKRESKYRFTIWWPNSRSKVDTRQCPPEVRATIDAALTRLEGTVKTDD